MLKKILVIAVSLAAVVGLGYLLATAIGKPVSTDLSVIGKGKPVLVLVYQNHSPTSIEALNSLNQIRNVYESRYEFVVADLGVPQGRAFASRSRMVEGQAIFMNQDGEPLLVTGIPADEQALRRLLDSQLAAME